MRFDWSDYSGDSGSPALPLFISERTQSLVLAVMRNFDSRFRWVDVDDGTWDDISGAISQAYDEIMNEVMMDATPVGLIAPYAYSNTVPAKWLACDGSTPFQDSYPDLYALIGTIYQYGNPTLENRFYLPDLRNRFVLGMGYETGEELAVVGGEESHTLTVAELPAHAHGFNTGGAVGGLSTSVVRASNANSSMSVTNTGGGNPHNNMPPFLRLYWIIKALP